MRSFVKGRLKPLLMIIGMLMLVGCEEQVDLPTRVGTNVWPGYEPLYLADHLGYFGRGKIKLAQLPSASEVLRAFQNGSLEAASLTLDEALLLQESNVSVKIVLVHDFSNGGDGIVARPEIKTMAELVGKRLAVEENALGAYMTTRALQIYGLDVDDIEIVAMEVDSHEEAFKSGTVDAAVTFEPVKTRLLATGGHEIFSSREISGEIVDVLVFHAEYLETHPDRAQLILNGWFATLEYMKKQPAEAAKFTGRRLRLLPEEVSQLYKGLEFPDVNMNAELIGKPAPGLAPVLRQLQSVMLKNSLMTDRVSIDDMFTDQPLIEPIK